MNPYVKHVLTIAAEEIGVVERGRANWGPRVSEYIASIGWNFPVYWCGAYVRWCLVQALKPAHLAAPEVPILTDLAQRDFGYCPSLGAYAEREGILEERPQAGDIFLVHNGKRFFHTGLVESVGNTGSFVTLEGNTNTDGSANGYGVFRRTRSLRPSTRFVRYADELKGSALPKKVPADYTLYLNDRQICPLPQVGGRSLAPVSVWGKALGFTVEFKPEEQLFFFDGRPVTLGSDLVLLNDRNHAPLRELVKLAGLRIARVDDQLRRVIVSR